jgi:hypothetical protein
VAGSERGAAASDRSRLSHRLHAPVLFTSVSTKAIERQNPELTRAAIKKINPVASNLNPQAVQKAMSRSPPPSVAYMKPQEQGGVPDTANRQMRRQAERMQQQARGGRPGAGGASSSRKRKRK